MKNRNHNSKFYSNSLILPVLELIGKGHPVAKIAEELKTPRPLIYYYISKAKKSGYVKEVCRDAFKVYELTQPGKNYLNLCEKNNDSYSWLQCRAENIQFIASIVRMPSIDVSWRRIQLKNWVRYDSEVDEVKVRVNLGVKPTIQFLPSPMEGRDPFDIYTRMVVDIGRWKDKCFKA